MSCMKSLGGKVKPRRFHARPLPVLARPLPVLTRPSSPFSRFFLSSLLLLAMCSFFPTMNLDVRNVTERTTTVPTVCMHIVSRGSRKGHACGSTKNLKHLQADGLYYCSDHFHANKLRVQQRETFNVVSEVPIPTSFLPRPAPPLSHQPRPWTL